MPPSRRLRRLALLGALVAAPFTLAQAQVHQHQPGMTHEAAAATPTEVGQAAFAAIAEIVRILEADPTTDWSKVNLEALRQHLRDMDLVLMRARVAQASVEGGLRMEVTGDGDVVDAIRRMLHSHGQALEGELPVTTSIAHHAQGLVLTVTAKNPADAAYVAKLRGLGFAGLLVTGDHHGPHHVMIARGLGGSHTDHTKH
ncbi:MAG: hypothetical protein ACFLMY_13765 [Candidatus Brachytrichaceae bacterium NZ_4S206]|jgi:hypothetical protein